MHLFYVRSPALVCRHNSYLPDLNGTGSCLMAASHISVCVSIGREGLPHRLIHNISLTAQGDSTSNCEITILSVHVMSARARVISKPHPYILDL